MENGQVELHRSGGCLTAEKMPSFVDFRGREEKKTKDRKVLNMDSYREKSVFKFPYLHPP